MAMHVLEDAVDARIEAGDTREAAVESALTELGDPERLADRYAGRPAYLIGPKPDQVVKAS